MIIEQAVVDRRRLGPSRRILPLPDDDQPVRVAVRQRAQQHGIDDAEDRRRGADRDTDGEHDGDGKASIDGEPAHGVLDVAARILEPGDRARLAVELLGPFDAAEREPGGTSRRVRRHAAAPMLVFEEREVRGDFTGEVVVGASRAQERRQPGREPAQPAHHSGSSASSRLTRLAERCHQAASSASARVPAFVIA